MTKLKQLLESNKTFKKIFKEEAIRAKRILREYNEAEIWKRLTITQREELLSNVDDDMGPDLADEYSEADWMDIPDPITNRIDISKYSADYAKSVDKSALMYARGIFSIIYDTQRFKNTKQLQDFIAKEVGAASTEQETLRMALMQYARDNSAKMMDLNLQTQRMSEPIVPFSSSTISGGTTPSSHPFYKGGASWTGD